MGAGLSCALGLPNTAQLIDGVLRLAEETPAWGVSRELPQRLMDAFEFFYPDGHLDDFRPDVGDFFASLATYVDVGAGLPGAGLKGKEAAELYDDLRFAICHLLIEKIRQVDGDLLDGHPYLDRLVRPGNIIITSNWDILLERYAEHHGVRIRHTGVSDSECVILKLHGSLDWLAARDRPRHRNRRHRYPDDDYCSLDELLCGPRPYTKPVPTDDEDLLRVRAFENLGNAWRQVKSRADRLHMVTMGTGKGTRLGELEPVWEDAYQGLSRAQQLTIVGYSMPPDDIEIRTLLRAGIMRGSADGPSITVRNPSPDVHHRLRAILDREMKSDYRSVPT